MSAEERTLYAAAWYERRRDTAGGDALLAALTPAERAEAAALLRLPGVLETLQSLDDDELRARMLSLAGKALEVPVNQHEPTTILPGGRGVPTVVVRDHDGWAAQVAAENRARQDEEVKAAVAAIRLADEERRWARPTPVADLMDGARANAALAREARDVLPRTMRELAQTEALVAGLAATEPPPPDAAAAAWQQANEYSYGLAETMARLRAPGR